MRTITTKPHIAHLLTLSLVWLILSANTNVALSAWEPPIGIPEPPFGITTTHTMYADPSYTYDYGNGPEPYRIGPDGPYTHYVDPDHPSATDDGNPYGTTTTPRLTRPPFNETLVEGSVVELHGGPHGGPGPTDFMGTAELPIFIRGVVGDEPTFTGVFSITSDYFILENIKVDLERLSRRTIMIGFFETGARTNIAIRGCEFYNGLYEPYESYQIIIIENDSEDANQCENIIIYDNYFHHSGEGRTGEHNDVQGISVRENASNIWIVDNHFCWLGADGIHVDCDNLSGDETQPHHLYIGRNTFHDMFENAVDLKNCRHTIVSQNKAYNFGPAYTTLSEPDTGAAAYRFGPQNVPKEGKPREYIWALFNEVYNSDSEGGAFASFSKEGTVEPFGNKTYYIGNVVHDCHNPDGDAVAFASWNQETIYFIGNTVYNCDGAGYFVGDTVGDLETEKITLVNNIFGDIAAGSSMPYNLKIKGIQASLDRMVINNNLFYNSSGDTQFKIGVSDGEGGVNFTIYSTYANFGTAYPGFVTGSVEDNPDHVDAANGDFHLQGNSPAIDAGADVQVYFDRFYDLYGIDISVDFDGNPIPRGSAPDIGAYEYVADPNNPSPVLQPIGDKSVDENVTLIFNVNATDPNGEAITYSVQYLPSGATFIGQTFNWTPSYTQAGSYQVRFIASDGNSSDSETITITVNNVNRAPVLGAISDQSVDENSILSFSVDATDPDGQALSYSVSGLPTGAVFAGQTFTWTPSYDQAGEYSVTFTADDGQAQDSQAITITVNNVNRAPVLTAINNQSVWSDDPLTFTVNATDPDGDTVTYSATTIPSGATFATQTFDWTPDQSQMGTYNVTFLASDGQLQDSQAITITVNVDSLAPTITNCSPTADSIQAPLNNLINLNITDAGKGINADSVTIKVNNNIMYSGNTDKHSSIYGECYRIGTKANYRFIYQPNEVFDYDQTVSITASATDLAGNAMNEQSYSFVTEMRSFGKNQNVDLGNLKKGRPATVSDSNGDIWAAWHAGPIGGSRDIYIGKLLAEEEYFGDIINLTEESTADQCNPVIAVGSDDKLYVAWQDNRPADDNNQGDWDIYISTSDDGMNWSSETRVNDPNNGNQINPAIVINGQSPNQAHVVWQDDRAGNQDIYIATSSNDFTTKTVSSQITSDISDQVEPAIAADSDNTIYVVWTDTRNSGKKDIYGAASNNGQWTNIPVVTEDDSQSSPAIATEAVGSILHLVWVDDRLGDDDIYYDKTIGGLSPLTGSSIIDDTTGADQISPVIITTGYTGNDLEVFAYWRDERNADADLYFVEIRSGNETNVFVGDNFTNSDQSEPAIGIDIDDYPYLVWTNERTDIYYAGSTFIADALASTNVTTSSTATVGTLLNAVNSIDDVSAEMPQGAYLCDVKITISKIKNPPKSNLELDRFSGTYEFGPSGMEFIEPVTITIPYEVNGSENVSYTAYWYNPLTDTLSQQGITDVETIVISSTLHALRFKTTHFSAFILGGGAAAALGGGGGGGCSVSAGSEGNIVEFILPYIGVIVVMVILKVRDTRYRKARNT